MNNYSDSRKNYKGFDFVIDSLKRRTEPTEPYREIGIDLDTAIRRIVFRELKSLRPLHNSK